MRPHGSAAELERRRRRAIALLRQGQGVREWARMIGVAPLSVSRWRDAYKAGGQNALTSKPVPGRPAKLSSAQRKRLIGLLKKGPRFHGYRNDLWTLARVAEVIRRCFKVHYDGSSVWPILRGMDWSCQKPERRARERDGAAIREWRKKDWPRIKKARRAGPQGQRA